RPGQVQAEVAGHRPRGEPAAEERPGLVQAAADGAAQAAGGDVPVRVVGVGRVGVVLRRAQGDGAGERLVHPDGGRVPGRVGVDVGRLAQDGGVVDRLVVVHVRGRVVVGAVVGQVGGAAGIHVHMRVAGGDRPVRGDGPPGRHPDRGRRVLDVVDV